MKNTNDLERYEAYLHSLKASEFEQLIYDLLLSTDNYKQLKTDYSENETQIDILGSVEPATSEMSDDLVAFEIKAYQNPVNKSTVDAALSKLNKLKEHEHNLRQFVLVSRSGFTWDTVNDHQHDLELKLWGPEELHKLSVEKRVQETAKIPKVDVDKILLNHKINTFKKLLDEVEAGRDQWSKYQSLIIDIFEFLFSPPLESPKIELSDYDKRNRRDIIFENTAHVGFWRLVRENYQGHYIVVDAKNYKKPLAKRPIIDIAHYLKSYGCGLFGIIVSREGFGGAATHAAKEQWIGGSKLIVSLSDEDVKKMLDLKSQDFDPEEVVRKYVTDFRMSL